MNFQVDEPTIIRLIMGYLSDHDSYEALTSLMLESGVSEDEFQDNAYEMEVAYVQNLILQGRLDDVLKYFEPIREDILSKS